jgi:ubiquinone/menaquinone biosynthesis C-methylase UbiE
MPEEELDQQIIELLKPFSLILDIGCGDGHLVNSLINQKGRQVVGLDISDHGFAEAKMTDHHNLVECVECDGRQIAFQASYFDAVILRFSLHHIEETQLALREIHLILAPRGMVLIGEWLVKDEDQPRDGCYRFTRAEIEQMSYEAGFQQKESEQIDADIVLVQVMK